MKLLRILLFLLVLCLSLPLVTSCTGKKEEGGATTADMAPDFSAVLLDGDEVKLSDFRGRVVLLNFWATWCPACKKEVPELQKIAEDYEGKKVVVLGVSHEKPEVIREAKGAMGITYLLATVEAEVFNTYRVKGIPQTFIIDKRGRIRLHRSGYIPGMEEELRKTIDRLLEAR